jgi:hypothetical protein
VKRGRGRPKGTKTKKHRPTINFTSEYKKKKKKKIGLKKVDQEEEHCE